MTRVLLITATAALWACGDQEQTSDTECAAWCEVRAPLERDQGFCPVDGWDPETRGCVASCEELGQTELDEFVQGCIEENALCFISMAQCLEGRRWVRDCQDWCGYRESAHQDDGFCDPSLPSLPETDCHSVCNRALTDDLPTDKVEGCIRDNPLCFIDLEQCVSDAP